MLGRYGKLAILLLAVALMLTACSPLVEDDAQSQPISVYATFYPIYALGALAFEEVPQAELHCLVAPQDGCLRNYVLSDWDSYVLQSAADAVIIAGSGLESFEASMTSYNLPIITVLLNKELYNQDEERSSDEDVSHLIGANPHLYMSVDGAKEIVEVVALYMTEIDQLYPQFYLDNYDAAAVRLDALKAQMADIAKEASGKGVILMNEAIIYLSQELNLTTAGWIDRESGVSMHDAELEDCLTELAAMEARVVLIEKQAPKTLTDALEEAGFSVAKIDILSTGREDMGAEGYFLAQLENARAIAKAFEDLEDLD